jgi:hypothetical protein
MAEDRVRANLVARIAKLEADLAEARVALKVIDSLRSKGTSARPAKQAAPSRSSAQSRVTEKKKTQSALIREAVDSFQHDFTLHDVIAYLERASGQVVSNRDVVSAMLSSLKESGHIFLVRKGGGGSPSVYRRNRDKPF